MSEEETKESSTWESIGVSETLAKTCRELGWKAPTEIQSESIPCALKGRDVIGLAQTGSGKTAAFAIPIIQSLMEAPSRLFACILAPTRELALQLSEKFKALGSSIGLKCVTLVGGVDEVTQAMILGRKPHIVIGTPGRLLYHLQNTKGFSLRSIKFLVLDEADRLLNLEFEEQITQILSVLPKERTTFLFSATMTSKVAKLQRASLKDPIKVSVSSKYDTVDSLIQQYCFVPFEHKDVYLTFILNEYAGHSTIVFVRTCDAAQRLSFMLRSLGFAAIPLHGQMQQSKRLGSLNKFKSGDRHILLATDVASRGLDIPSVDLIVNYDIPTHSKDYIHRVGRTARAGRSGKAITIFSQYDVELYMRIEQMLGKKLLEYPTEEDTVLVLLERVTEARRFAALEMKEMHQKRTGRRKRGQQRDEDDESRAHRRVVVEGKYKKRGMERKYKKRGGQEKIIK